MSGKGLAGQPCSVKADYQAVYPSADHPKVLAVRAGETVRVGQSDDEYPGWVWCTNSAGNGGWVPEAYIRWSGDNGILLRDYAAIELSVRAGEEVTLLDEESGWGRVTDASGQTGWVPLANLEKRA